MQNMFYTSWYT